MVFKTSIVALLTAAMSSVVLAQGSNSESTIVENKPSGVFEGTSLSLWNYATANTKGGENAGEMSYGVEPHFNIPFLNTSATLDIYGEFTMGTSGDRAHIQEPAGTADLQQVFISNDYVTLDPWIRFDNLFSGNSSLVIKPTFSGMVALPTLFQDFKLTPYALNESSVSIFTGKKETEVDYLKQEAGSVRALSPEESEAQGEQVITVDKTPVSTYTRFAVAVEPNAAQGLKVTLGANVIASRNSKPVFQISAEEGGEGTVTNYSKSWDFVSQPMFRIDYAINDQLSFRNTTTVDFEEGFERLTADQKAAGAVTNVSRLIYTIY